MNTLAPYCPLPITNPARAYVSSHDTDIRKTLAEHTPIHVNRIQDDYELTDSLDWLSAPGGFK